MQKKFFSHAHLKSIIARNVIEVTHNKERLQKKAIEVANTTVLLQRKEYCFKRLKRSILSIKGY